MNQVKHIALLIVGLVAVQFTFAQKDPFSYLHKAQEQYKAGKNQKALNTLQRADTRNYKPAAFCGNAIMDYNKESNILRANIYMDKKEYLKARSALNAILMENFDDNLDSIRIITYQLEFGEDSLKAMFDFTLSSARIDCLENDCYVFIPLSNNTNMQFKTPIRYDFKLGASNNESAKLNLWREDFRAYKNLELIKGIH